MTDTWHTEQVIADTDGGAYYVLKGDSAPTAEDVLARLVEFDSYLAHEFTVDDVSEVTCTPCKGHDEFPDLFFAEDTDGPGSGWPSDSGLEPIGPHATYWKVGE